MRNDESLAALVLSMFDNVVPPLGMAFHHDEPMSFSDMRAFFARTGMIPVFDSESDTPLFDDPDTYYKMIAWFTYRSFCVAAYEDKYLDTFGVIANDVLRYAQENKKFDVGFGITFLDGILNATKEYGEKFGHEPCNLDKFITSFMKHGRASVLRADIY